MLEMFNRLSLMASTTMKNVIDRHQKYFGKKLQSNLDKINNNDGLSTVAMINRQIEDKSRKIE
jgi:hypothetical protein